MEEYHEERFLALKANIEQGKVFKRDEVVEWKCQLWLHPQGHRAAEELPCLRLSPELL